MKKIVISGINIRDGGTLSVFRSLLDDIVRGSIYKRYEIIALVSKKELFQEYLNYISVIDFPKEHKSRVLRFYYEYIWTKKFSKKNDIYCWISINDKTPKVKSIKQFVYCHNPTIFYKCTWKDFYFSKLLFLYTLFYKNLYKHNIRRNDCIIVQQHWIAKEFTKRFHVENVAVMRPSLKEYPLDNLLVKNDNKKIVFFYPSFPRSFKNFETICEAVKVLNHEGIVDFTVMLTIGGKENRYSKYLIKKYANVANIEFIGLLNGESMLKTYAMSNCLIFPSKLETWGLPLTEFSKTGRQIIAADLPYAHETLRDYQNVSFFKPNDFKKLALLMEQVIDGISFNKASSIRSDRLENPEIESWISFFNTLDKGQ